MASAAKTVRVSLSGGRRKNWGLLRLQGNLTLDTVADVQRAFREGLQKYKSLQVEVDKVTGMDLGFLQLLHALQVALTAQEGELQVQLRLEEELDTLLRNTGFACWLEEAPTKRK